MQQFLPLSALLNEQQTSAIAKTDAHCSYGAALDPFSGSSEEAHLQAEHEWLGGLTALIKLLLELPPDSDSGSSAAGELMPLMGGVLSGPFPVLPDRLMGQRLSHWLLVPEPLEQILAVTRPLLPGQGKREAVGYRWCLWSTMTPWSLSDFVYCSLDALVCCWSWGMGPTGCLSFSFPLTPRLWARLGSSYAIALRLPGHP